MKNASFKQNHISERPPLLPRLRDGEVGVRFSLGLRLFTALALFSIFTSCCKDDCLDPTNPDCDNYDPCYGKTQPSAKFIMEEAVINEKARIVWIADSTFSGDDLRFSSELTDDKYKHTWYVGTEVFDGPETPSRAFDQVPRPQTISISHVIEYTPDLQCFPDDDGKDSVAQEFDLIALWNDLKIYGTFRGAFEGTTDSFDINFSVLDMNDQPAYYSNLERTRTINFHNEGDTLFSDATGNRLAYFGRTDYRAFASSPPDLTMVLDENNRFVLKYQWYNNGYQFYKVVGRKLQ